MPDTPASASPPPDSAATESPSRFSGTTFRRAGAWVATGLWAGVIFGFSALPGSLVPGRFGQLGHLGEYAIFGGLLYLALSIDLDRGQAIAVAIIVASAYGVSDEFHQHFVVMRTPDVVDWGLDTLGAACGALAAWGLTAWLSRRRSAPRSSDPRQADAP